MLDSSRRQLLQALAVSLLLHAALLGGGLSALPLRFAPSAPALRAELRQFPPAPAAASRSLPSAAANAVAETAPRARIAQATENAASVLTPAAPVVAAAAPAAVAPSAAAVANPLPSTPPVGDPAAPRNEAGTAASARRSGFEAAAGGSGRDGVNADDLRQYRVSIASAARRFKRYPPLARERGWEGTSEVALDVRGFPPAPQVALMQSSGRPLIDEQALATIRQAARVTSLPEGLKGRDFRVLFSIVFNLEDEQ